MNTIKNNIMKADEKGQGLVEYALILVLVAIVLIVLLLLISGQLQQAYCGILTAIQQGKVPDTCLALKTP